MTFPCGSSETEGRGSAPEAYPRAVTDSLTHSLDLLRRAKDGDEVALNRLCERYYERVRRVVRMRLGRGLREMVDSGDILQETFLQAVRAFDGFETRDEASLVNWLCKLAERQIIAAADYHGAQKRDHRRQFALDDGGPAGDDGPGGLIARLSDETRVPLDKLAEKEQAAIVES